MSSAVGENTETEENIEKESSVKCDNPLEATETVDCSPVQVVKVNSKIIFDNESIFKDNAETQINFAKFDVLSSRKDNLKMLYSEKKNPVISNPKLEEIYEDYGTGTDSGINGNKECIIQQLDIREGLRKFFEDCFPDEDGLVSKRDIVLKFEDTFKECVPKNYLDIVKENVMLLENEAINFETFYSALKCWIENILMNKTCSFSSPDRQVLNFKIVDTPISSVDSDLEEYFPCSGYQPFCIVRDDPTRRSTLEVSKLVHKASINDFPLPSPIQKLDNGDLENEEVKRIIHPDLEETFDFTVGSIETDSNITPLDPVELKDEVLELTFANQRLTRERDILSSQNIQADLAHAALRKKCENIGNSLESAQLQIAKLRNIEEENRKLKTEIAEHIQVYTELKNKFASSQDNYDGLLKNFESLKEEAESSSEKLKQTIQEKEKLSSKISKYLNEINNLNKINSSLFEKLNAKDLKIEGLSSAILCLEEEIEKLQNENSNLMEELHQLKDDHYLFDLKRTLKAEIALANNNLIEEDYSVSVKSNDSEGSLQSPSSSETKGNEREVSSPVNIRDEICSSDISDVGSSLPFCEKSSTDSSAQSQKLLTSLHKSLSKLKNWNKQTESFVEDLYSNDTLDDEAQSLLEVHVDELVNLTKKWRTFLNLRIECDVSTLKKKNSPEHFSLASWSSLVWEDQRDDAAVSKSKDEDEIAEQSTIITPSECNDPSKDITEKDSKIEDLLSPKRVKGSSLSGTQDMYKESFNVPRTKVRDGSINTCTLLDLSKILVKSSTKDIDKTMTSITVPPDSEDVVSSSTESSILNHVSPPIADEIKDSKIQKDPKFHASTFKGAYSSHDSERTPDERSMDATHRSRKIVLFIIGILSIILSVCSILSYLLRKEAHKWCYNSARGHGAWIPFFHVKYSGDPPY